MYATIVALLTIFSKTLIMKMIINWGGTVMIYAFSAATIGIYIFLGQHLVKRVTK